MKAGQTCVRPDGTFAVGIHRPSFKVTNFRENQYLSSLGQTVEGDDVDNHINFPEQDLSEPGADIIYEIPNPFPFRGATFINTAWAESKAGKPENIGVEKPQSCSFLKRFNTHGLIDDLQKKGFNKDGLIDLLPRPLLLALAQSSTDPEELILIAKKSCRIIVDPDSGAPTGIGFRKNDRDQMVPDIMDHDLFEVVGNNQFLPDDYKNTLVLKPGVQGNNEITGEYLSDTTHVFEYLRRNSYIPWGHFASNMANDTIRYRAKDLTKEDMTGIRHLYYQRIYSRLASQLDIPIPNVRKNLDPVQLETLRQTILNTIFQNNTLELSFNASLWGWNYGFGFSQSGHRLHASHQMIHQQNAMIPEIVPAQNDDPIPSFACGDLIQQFIRGYKALTGTAFFKSYLKAIKNNIRTDGRTDLDSSLIVHEDENVMLFVPKAQISEWELQLMPKTAVGNILEADVTMRKSLDLGIVNAVRTLDKMGAQMVTSIEFSKRFDDKACGQHLLYSFIPRLPYAPDTFSEAQLRWISGSYPEDVAAACRMALASFS